jgi:hypothetical protein
MAATGLGFATLTSLWPLLLVAFMGSLNPSGGDVSVFLPLEGVFGPSAKQLYTARFRRACHYEPPRVTAGVMALIRDPKRAPDRLLG